MQREELGKVTAMNKPTDAAGEGTPVTAEVNAKITRAMHGKLFATEAGEAVERVRSLESRLSAQARELEEVKRERDELLLKPVPRSVVITSLQDALKRAGAERYAAEQEAAQLRADAERWRKLVGCARVRLLGYARGGPRGDEGAIRHIGFELTTDAPGFPNREAEKSEGVKTFIEFVAALPSPAAQLPEVKDER
jgi:hypothetical protein